MFVSKRSLEDDFRSLDEKIEDIHAIVTEEIQNNTNIIDNNIKWLNSSITIYRTQLNDLEDRICLLEECETDIPNTDKAVKITEIYNKISTTERKIADLRSRFVEYRTTAEEWQDKTNSAVSEINSRINNLEETTQSLMEVVETHKKEKEVSDTYQQQIKQANNEMAEEIVGLQSQLKECNQKLLVQDDLINRMQELIKNLYKEITTIKGQKIQPIIEEQQKIDEIPQRNNKPIPKLNSAKETLKSTPQQNIEVEKQPINNTELKNNYSEDGSLQKEKNLQNIRMSASKATEKFVLQEAPSRVIFGKNENVESIERKVNELCNFQNVMKCIDTFDNSAKNRYRKCMNNYKSQLIKTMAEINLENIEPENVSSVVSESFFKVLSTNIIDVFIPVLYTIIRNGRGENRETHLKLLQQINIYLEKCCIYTKNISFDEIPSERILDMMTINRVFNKNPELAHHISEIKLLPYCINYVGSDGKKAVLLKKGMMTVYKG